MEQIKGIWALARENMRRDMSALSFNHISISAATR